MDLFYRSTRSKGEAVKASEAILKGLADDGGLFVPESVPTLDKSLEELSQMTYQETAYEVMKLFLTDFTEAELKDCINKAYDSKFDTEVIAPLVEADGAYYLELFHGSTITLPFCFLMVGMTFIKDDFLRLQSEKDYDILLFDE